MGRNRRPFSAPPPCLFPNRRRPSRLARRMRVTEIFFSIQGEGTRAGLPCVFVRFTGCDLRCVYCDTAYAFHGGAELTEAAILEEVERHPGALVLLTGGEPMLQRGLPGAGAGPPGARLRGAGGDARAAPARRAARRGGPHRGREDPGLGRGGDGPRLPRPARPARRGEVRGLLGGRLRLVVRGGPAPLAGGEGATCSFSPVWGKVEPKELARWLLESGLRARLSLQVHKVIWGAEARGV